MEPRDPYTVLGVSRQASGPEIARAYRRAARASHPDGGSSGSAERFHVVSDAYEVLRNPHRRAVYDRSHPTEPPGGEPRRRSATYSAPMSQHIVLGRRTSPGAAPPWDEMAPLVIVSFLRAGR